MPGTESTRTARGEPTERLPDEVVADLLADDRCRQALAVLVTAEDALAVDDLARSMLARERDVEPAAVDDEAAATLREELFQCSLPRLTPTGLVEYDSMLGTVALGTDDERVRSAIES